MDDQAKKALLRMLDYGLFVVGAADGDQMNASTVNWLSQCSFQPPCVMVAIKHGTTLHELITHGRVFSVNFLGKEQQALAEHFFRPVHQVGDKLGDITFHRGTTGAPVLENAIGSIECRVREVVSGGDHDVVVGEVVEASLNRDAPLLTLADTGWHYGG